MKKYRETICHTLVLPLTLCFGGCASTGPTVAETGTTRDLSEAVEDVVRRLNLSIPSGGQHHILLGQIPDPDGQTSRFSTVLRDELASAITVGQVAKVVERERLDSVLQELRTQLSDLVDPTQARKIGKFTGADYLLAGRYHVTSKSVTLFITLTDIESATQLANHRIEILRQHIPTEYLGGEAPQRRRSVLVAVLPFANESSDPGIEWLTKGIAESVTTALGRVPGVRLVERLQIEKVMKELSFQSTHVVDATTAQEIGKVLGVDFVVIGSYQKFGKRLRFDARRVKVETGEVYETRDAIGVEDQVFDLQKQLGKGLRNDIEGQVTP